MIESILMGIPIPVIYVFEDENSKKQVVDGRQRISAGIDLLSNKFALDISRALNTSHFCHFDRREPKGEILH